MKETHGTKIRLNLNPITLTKSLVIGDHLVSLRVVLVRSFSLVSMDGAAGSSTIWIVKQVFVTHLHKGINVTQMALCIRATQVIMSLLNWLVKLLLKSTVMVNMLKKLRKLMQKNKVMY